MGAGGKPPRNQRLTGINRITANWSVMRTWARLTLQDSEPR